MSNAGTPIQAPAPAGTSQSSPAPKQTTASTQQPDYKSEFIQTYQNAGVIGVSMLTLIALCLLLGMFALRLLKMYITLTETRDKQENARLAFFDKLTLSMLALQSDLKQVQTELKSDHQNQEKSISEVQKGVDRVCHRLDSIMRQPYPPERNLE